MNLLKTEQHEQITIEDFLYHMQVAEDKRKAASGINASYEHWIAEDEENMRDVKQENIMDMSIFGPEIRYKMNFGHSYIQLKFRDDKNVDYKRLKYFLEKYEDDLNDFCANEDRNDFPVLTIVIVPTFYNGKYYMACSNLLMFRTYTDDTGVYLEFLFDGESISINETDQIELAAINQQIKKEEEERAYIEQKYMEEKEYEAEREQKRAELRKKKQKREKGR